jgi:hypothetical protein
MTIFAPRIANVVMLPPVSAIVAVPSSARKRLAAQYVPLKNLIAENETSALVFLL